MSQFNFKSLDAPADKTLEYTFYQIQGDKKPVLTVVQANESNKSYWNAYLRRNSALGRRLRGGRLTPEILDETREADRELFSKFIVKGWKHCIDVNGTEVSFSQEDCLAFLKALPNWVFDDFRNFSADIQNFLEEDVADEEAVSGNLPTG